MTLTSEAMCTERHVHVAIHVVFKYPSIFVIWYETKVQCQINNEDSKFTNQIIFDLSSAERTSSATSTTHPPEHGQGLFGLHVDM